MKTDWYRLSAAETMRRLRTDAVKGLSATEARNRLVQNGPNALAEKPGRSRGQIIREQLGGVLNILLYVAVLISMALDDWLESVVILIIVVLNAALGYVQEFEAEQSLAALKRMSVPKVRVRRDGQVQEVSALELVSGDVVILETGNIVPADGRLIQGVNLRVEEATLTGESEPVEKNPDLTFQTERALGDRRNMLFSGTTVTSGRGEFVATDTGMRTELGHIAGMIQGVEREQTPLQQRLNRLGRVLAYAALVLVAAIIILGLLRGEALQELLLTAVSLAVAAVPEALTAVVTIALSLGAKRMLKRRALIRKLPAVETLGSVTVVCSDKTGTLTLNRMTVTALDVANHKFELAQVADGRGFQLMPLDGAPATGAQPTLDLVFMAGALCNDAALAADEKSAGRYRAVGDPTEGALVLAAAFGGIRKDDLDDAFPRLAEVPFDSVRKRMTTLHQMPQSSTDVPASLLPIWERRLNAPIPPYIAFTKGALDGMLPIASNVWVEDRSEPLEDYWRAKIVADHNQMAAKGMRVLCVGMRVWNRPPDETTEKSLERDLTLLGLFGMVDPPRPEVCKAVLDCRNAGIRPVMITGDHPLTARHIAQQVGIADSDRFLTGREIERMPIDELTDVVKEVSVFARVSPEHKLKLIDAYQRQHNIVSMTGDGVNDAPALKKADIGVAMGLIGTDVAKSAADMVLLDDNFATIVAAVEEGRVIYDNIRRFIKYLLTCNTSEIAVMLLGPVLGMPLPLLPLQILWMNLVTDGLPALALAVEPAEKSVMKRPPYSAAESIFGRGMAPFILIIGALMSIACIGSAWELWRERDPGWQTVLLSTLVFIQLAVALEARSEQEPLYRIGLLKNRLMVLAVVLTVILQLLVVYLPAAQHIFGTRAMTLRDLALSIGLALPVLICIEIWKAIMRRKRP